MAPRPAPGSSSQLPYFFLSYAHIPPHDQNRQRDPNKWVVKLFGDLCDHIMNMTNLPKGAQAGFMDVDLRSGHHWPERLADALATCRVFVPLYSPRYFESEQCGKEWAAFQQRMTNHAGPDGQLPEAIVPALWTPLPADQLPQVAQAIQFTHDGLGPRYQDEGFYGLIKITSMRSHYQRATLALAKRIVEVAHSTYIASTRPPPEYHSLTSAFPDYRAERPLKVTIAAPDLGTLPPERNPYFYGLTPQEWNPYRGENCTRPLASYAADVVSAYGFLPQVGSLDEHASERTAEESPGSPAVMLVDPWATMGADCRERLRDLNRPEPRWVSVIVPWNNDDAQTAQARDRLRASVDGALDEGLTDLGTDVESLSAFHRALPDALGRAANHFFKTARTYPPEGPATKKPRLLESEEPR
ncbi:TIR-like protein FxsC [Microtetraspora malaysiensis]|uniref:TIR-like protein FxsC n=1 Tax=Microtetraspora malaysiensis TaxID=161358 RepID=UPI003D91495F